MMTFDELMDITRQLPDDLAVYNKTKARQYITARNDFIRYVDRTVTRSDIDDAQKVRLIRNSPGLHLR